MATTAADVLIDALCDWEVEVVFGLPGGIHLLNGRYDAKLDGQPVLAVTGLPIKT